MDIGFHEEWLDHEWNPNGNGFWYSYGNSDGGFLYYWDLTNKNTPILIEESSYWDIPASFSPNGKKLVYSYYHDDKYVLKVIDIATKETEVITTTKSLIHHFYWSPNSDKVAYLSEWSIFDLEMLYILDLETGENKCITCESFWNHWDILRLDYF